MQRDEIQIEAEKRYAVEEAREDAFAEGAAIKQLKHEADQKVRTSR